MASPLSEGGTLQLHYYFQILTDASFILNLNSIRGMGDKSITSVLSTEIALQEIINRPEIISDLKLRNRPKSSKALGGTRLSYWPLLKVSLRRLENVEFSPSTSIVGYMKMLFKSATKFDLTRKYLAIHGVEISDTN